MNNSIEKYQPSSIEEVSNRIAITNKIILRSSIGTVINFLKDNREFTIKLISKHYPLTDSLLEEFEEYWDWENGVSLNEKINWDAKLIDKYFSKFEVTDYEYTTWWNLCINNSVPWDFDLLTRFCDKFNSASELFWSELSGKKNVVWTSKLLEEFSESFEWEGSGGISSNESIPWTLELIDQFKYDISFKWMSVNTGVPWSIHLIDLYIDEWYWGKHEREDVSLYQALSINESIPWSEELIDRYKDKINFKLLSEVRSVPWSKSIIEKYATKWEWSLLKTTLAEKKEFDASLVFSLKEKFPGWYELSSYINHEENLRNIRAINSANWDWDFLSYQFSAEWELILLDIFKAKWNWSILSANENILWTTNLIERFSDVLDWYLLSKNTKLPWSFDFIKRYEDRWCLTFLDKEVDITFEVIDNLKIKLGSGEQIDRKMYDSLWTLLTKNKGVHITRKILSEFEDRFHWGDLGLSDKEELQWSVELLVEFKDKWNWNTLLQNRALYRKAFQPFLNDQVIRELMNEITVDESQRK